MSRAEQNDGHLDEQEVDTLLKRDGPFLYELFSVMVHQGSASGGHYFAYIKWIFKLHVLWMLKKIACTSVRDVHECL